VSRARAFPIEGVLLLYLLSYLPNVIATKLITSVPHAGLGRPLTGLETLPASLIVSMVTTYTFIWLARWHRDAHSVRLGTIRLPRPTRYTLVSGIGTAFILFTVPLSFTIPHVSIPFMQLLMRGDILVIAPLVDFVFGRRVRWWSWVALALVLVALLVTLGARGGLKLPPIAILTVILYTLGYFIRLTVMNKVSKTGEQASVRRYFVEEKVIALPLAVAALAAISATGISGGHDELRWGFVSVWSDSSLPWLIFIGLTLTVISVFSIVILLDPHENAYCVPLERAASLIAGVGGALILAWIWGLQGPHPTELIGAGILIAAVMLLSVAPRLTRQTRPALAEPA